MGNDIESRNLGETAEAITEPFLKNDRRETIKVLATTGNPVPETNPVAQGNFKCGEFVVFIDEKNPNLYAVVKFFEFGAFSCTFFHTHSQENDGACAAVNRGDVPIINIVFTTTHNPVSHTHSIIVEEVQIFNPGEGMYDKPQRKAGDFASGHAIINPNETNARTIHGYHAKNPAAANDEIYQDNDSKNLHNFSQKIIQEYAKILQNPDNTENKDGVLAISDNGKNQFQENIAKMIRESGSKIADVKLMKHGLEKKQGKGEGTFRPREKTSPLSLSAVSEPQTAQANQYR